jgi:anaerobic selenocysteine-containing dehydrogenase
LWDGPSSSLVAAFEFAKARIAGMQPKLVENRKVTVPMRPKPERPTSSCRARLQLDTPADDREVLPLITLRSNSQFNTTIYSYDDRFRGIYGSRLVVLMNGDDMARLGLSEGMVVEDS